MKKIKVFSVILFILSVVIYGAVHLKHARMDDSIAPRISMEADSIEVSVTDGEDAILAGITASDSNDGDVSDTLIVESMGQFLSPGRRNVTIAAFDSSSNVAKVTREVNYTDYSSPRFTLTEPLRFPLNTSNILENLTATDCLDGDITNQIKTSAATKIDPTTAANYDAVFTVTNSAGDTVQLPCTVTIYDNNYSGAPQIELSEYLIYVPAGTEINPWDYVTAITKNGRRYERGEDGNLYTMDGVNSITKGDLSIKGQKNMDLNTPGAYEYTYKFNDDSGRTGSVRLIVAVV